MDSISAKGTGLKGLVFAALVSLRSLFGTGTQGNEKLGHKVERDRLSLGIGGRFTTSSSSSLKSVGERANPAMDRDPPLGLSFLGGDGVRSTLLSSSIRSSSI